MLCRTCIVQIQSRKHVRDHAEYTDPARQHLLGFHMAPTPVWVTEFGSCGFRVFVFSDTPVVLSIMYNRFVCASIRSVKQKHRFILTQPRVGKTSTQAFLCEYLFNVEVQCRTVLGTVSCLRASIVRS